MNEENRKTIVRKISIEDLIALALAAATYEDSRKCPQEPRKGRSEANSGEGCYYVPPELFAALSEAKNGQGANPTPKFHFNRAKRTVACVSGNGPSRRVGKAKSADGDPFDPMVGAMLAYFRMAHPEEYRHARDIARAAADSFLSDERVRKGPTASAVEVDPEVGRRFFDAFFGVGAKPAPEPKVGPEPKKAKTAPKTRGRPSKKKGAK